jgi:hypothetical protein
MFAALADVKYKYEYAGCYKGNSRNLPQNLTVLVDKITGKYAIDAADAKSLPGGVIQYCAERAISNGYTENMVFTVSGLWSLGVGCKF